MGKKFSNLFIVLSALFLCACVLLGEQQNAPIIKGDLTGKDLQGRVEWVSDGDTLKLAGEASRIRIWGIDAPEMSEAQGAASKAFMIRLVAGQELSCKRKDIDRYQRIVARCYIKNKDIGLAAIKAGQAQEYCRFSRNYYGYC